MSKRRDYHRGYYQENAEALSERKQEERDNFDRATTYWRQKKLLNRDLPWLIKGIPDAIVERARVAYDKVLAQYEPETVEKKALVSTRRKR
ncbi:MAG: hypothetical protein PHP93_08025 [Kiritimatiellales bacterium]|nr:hypothetical protein [Kiritimatiellales bacterium]